MFGKKEQPNSEEKQIVETAFTDEMFETMPRGGVQTGGDTTESATNDLPEALAQPKHSNFIRKWWLLFAVIGLVLVLAVVLFFVFRSGEEAQPIPPPAPASEPVVPAAITERTETGVGLTGLGMATLTVTATDQKDIAEVEITLLVLDAASAFTLPTDSILAGPLFRVDVPDEIEDQHYAATLTYVLTADALAAGEGDLMLVYGSDGSLRPPADVKLDALESTTTLAAMIPELKTMVVGIVRTPPLSPSGETSPATVATEKTTQPLIPITDLPFGIDTDSDGLTDQEELLFGTDRLNADTDGDTYVDGEEVKNGYSPRAGNGVRLETSGLVNRYTNPLFGYSLLYPAEFLVRAMDETNREVIFTAVTGEFMQILTEEVEYETTDAWFAAQFPDNEVSVQKTVIVGNATGRFSPDGRALYAVQDGKLYTFGYNTVTASTVNYPFVFELMVTSFRFTQ